MPRAAAGHHPAPGRLARTTPLTNFGLLFPAAPGPRPARPLPRGTARPAGRLRRSAPPGPSTAAGRRPPSFPSLPFPSRPAPSRLVLYPFSRSGPQQSSGAAGQSHVSRGASDPHRGEQRGARRAAVGRRLLSGLGRGAGGRRLFPLVLRHAEGGPDGTKPGRGGWPWDPRPAAPPGRRETAVFALKPSQLAGGGGSPVSLTTPSANSRQKQPPLFLHCWRQMCVSLGERCLCGVLHCAAGIPEASGNDEH